MASTYSRIFNFSDSYSEYILPFFKILTYIFPHVSSRQKSCKVEMDYGREQNMFQSTKWLTSVVHLATHYKEKILY